MKSPRCIIIAGPNGAGKTTFAREFLPQEEVIHFVNADLLAAGLSPLKPSLAVLNAGRLFLAELDRGLAKARQNFAFESTLSGLTYVSRLKRLRSAGYCIEIAFSPARLDRVGITPYCYSASDKVATTARRRMFCGDLIADGKILRAFTNRWRTRGLYMIIQVKTFQLIERSVK